MIRRYLPKSTEQLVLWYERYVSPISLLIGFTIDAVAVQVLDLQIYSLVLIFHLVLAASGIVALHMIGASRLQHPFLVSIAQFIPVAVQYSFGGLFSGFILLYSQSAAFAVSWVFVVLLAAFLLSNERFRRVYTTFPVQIGILYFALFSFLIFFLPTVTKTVDSWMFLASGLLSIGVIGGFLSMVWPLLKGVTKEVRTTTVKIVIGTFCFITALYFLGAIPPMPLALRDAGVFHSLTRNGDIYTVTYEPRAWHEVYLRYNRTFHHTPGEPVYAYAAIFAPDGIATTIVHEWQRYDEVGEEWVTESTHQFPIVGGRDGGYRGYTLKRDVEAGSWRVNVETDYGQLIGRVVFEVVEVKTRPFLEVGER